MIRFLKTCLIVSATLALASCSAISVVYNNAPSFAGAEIESAFALEDEQRALVDTALLHFFAWHRQQELARYRQILDAAALAVADGITAEDYLKIYNDARAAGRRAVTRAIDDLYESAQTLTPEQIDHFDAYFREESEKYQDYLALSMQQRAIESENKNLKRMEDWFGSLDDLQQDKIRARLQSIPEVRSVWVEYREARHQAFIAALRKAPSEGLSRQKLKQILLGTDTDYARVYEPRRIAYRQAYAQMIEEVNGWLSKAQIAHAAERLRDYASIVAELENDA